MIVLSLLSCLIMMSKLYLEAKLIDFHHATCLPQNERASWDRYVFYNKDPLIIESTQRSSHRLVSFIIAILLKERLGYSNINFRETRWDDTADTLNRLTCNMKPCGHNAPLSHINLEVWMSPGFTSREWVSENLIIDCGPLGPSARTGVFYYNSHASELPVDDWRSLTKYPNQDMPLVNMYTPTFKQLPIYRYCNDSVTGLCATKFAIDPALPLEHASFLNKIFGNWTVGSNEADNSHFLFFNWYPNTLTVQHNFSRVLFPDCHEGIFSSASDVCEASVNQLTKVVWSELRSRAPLIYNVIDKFQIPDEHLLGLLKKLKIHSNTAVDYFQVACQWILENRNLWIDLTPLWNKTRSLKTIVMLPLHDGNISGVEEHALMNGFDNLNKDMNYFGSLQFQLQIKLLFVSCGPNEMLEEYLTSVNIEESSSDNPIVGIITGLPTECMELVSKITNAQKKVTISFRHEIYPMSLRYRNTSYIFQTISSKETYYALILKISKHFGWTRNVIITDNNDYLSGFNSTFILKAHLFDPGNETVLIEFIKKYKEEFNAKIFLVDIMGDDIFKILCLAGKLKMTLENGYIWFINTGLVGKETPSKLINCAQEIDSIRQNSFYLSSKDPSSVESCTNLYPDNLHRAMTILGRAASNMTKMNPGFTTFNVDDMVNNIKEINTDQYFCSGAFISHPSVKMEHNSLFWPQWFLYQINDSKYKPIFKFKISSKYEIDDMVQDEMSKENPVFWGENIIDVPDDGKIIEGEKCWAQFLAKILNIKCDNAEILLIIGITMVLLFSLVISLLLMYRKRIRENNYSMGAALKLLVQDLLDIDIHSSNLYLNHVIGKGAFGMVYGGEARNNRGVLEAVAVKVISENSDWVEKMNFLTEAKVMRKLHHQNIVELTGVSLDNENNMIFLIMELMVEGDLRNYLLSRRSNAAMNPDSTELRTRLTEFSRDIAEGLNYMHSKYMVHRDVACRNCLISHDIRVKLGDFGLTKYLQPASLNGYYKDQGNLSLPVRWMPPEAIQFGLFSIKSDIWSFGILLFEIVTFGVCPYQDLSSSRNFELMEQIKNNHLSIINYLPTNAYDSVVHRLISKCCSYNSSDRPDSMEPLLTVLKSDKTCIRPHLTDDPPKSEGDKKLNDLSGADLPRLVFEEEELPVTSPSEIQLSSSQKYIDLINKAFRIKHVNLKDKNDFPIRKLRPCQSSVTISRDLLATDAVDCIPLSRTSDLLVGSIPSDLCQDMRMSKKNRTPTFRLSPWSLNNKFRFSSKDL